MKNAFSIASLALAAMSVSTVQAQSSLQTHPLEIQQGDLSQTPAPIPRSDTSLREKLLADLDSRLARGQITEKSHQRLRAYLDRGGKLPTTRP